MLSFFIDVVSHKVDLPERLVRVQGLLHLLLYVSPQLYFIPWSVIFANVNEVLVRVKRISQRLKVRGETSLNQHAGESTIVRNPPVHYQVTNLRKLHRFDSNNGVYNHL
jgi:hypothetical protein